MFQRVLTTMRTMLIFTIQTWKGSRTRNKKRNLHGINNPSTTKFPNDTRVIRNGKIVRMGVAS